MSITQTTENETEKESRSSQKNAFKINLENGVRITDSIKTDLKNKFSCQFSDIYSRWICPSESREEVKEFLENQKAKASLEDVIHEFIPNDINNIDIRIAILEKEYNKESGDLVADIAKYNKQLRPEDFKESPSTDGKNDIQIELERGFHERCVEIEEKKVLIENLRNSKKRLEGENALDDVFDDDLMGSEEANQTKARSLARQRAMKNDSIESIKKELKKRYPAIKQQVDDIAKKAVKWAKNFQNGCEVIVDGVPKKITDMESLNSRFAQLEAPGQPCVIVNRMDASPITNADYNKRLSGEVVCVGVDRKGSPKYVSASRFWEGNTHKHIYRKIVFNNEQTTSNDYNLFPGFGVVPKEGNCDKIINHIKEVVCSGDDEKSKALLNLNAWQVQNIGKPSRIITALQSNEQQIGKGLYCNEILAPIFGESGLVTSDIGKIIGRFNDTIRGRAFIFLDECLFSGDRKAADAIKSLATATRISIESKGVPTVQFPCATNLFLSTNHEDAAHIEESDARYWVLQVSPHRHGDTAYFKEILDEINGGGLSAFLLFLLNRDVKSFVPQRDVPIDNEAKNKMIKNSINPFDARKWLEECCLSGWILGCNPRGECLFARYKWEKWKEGEEYENGIFWTAYTEWMSTVRSPIAPKPTSVPIFGRLLNKAGFELRIHDQRRRTLPNATECLKKVTEMMEKKLKSEDSTDSTHKTR